MRNVSAETVDVRFAFGSNWRRFLDRVDDRRIRTAENSLKAFLMMEDLKGKRFLDVGSGSGLFSLAARRLGACVHSFDYDPESVVCTAELKRRFFDKDTSWTVEQGSILDKRYVQSIGQFDVVYSWGVLHHTGAMWQTLENVSHLVAEGGKLFIAIYNDQGPASRRWLVIKRLYNELPRFLRPLLATVVGVRLYAKTIAARILRFQVGRLVKDFSGENEARGMSPWYDLIDWVGGYPFEVAKPEEIFNFCRERGFVLERLRTCGGGHGCNEFVFVKVKGSGRHEREGPG